MLGVRGDATSTGEAVKFNVTTGGATRASAELLRLVPGETPRQHGKLGADVYALALALADDLTQKHHRVVDALETKVLVGFDDMTQWHVLRRRANRLEQDARILVARARRGCDQKMRKTSRLFTDELLVVDTVRRAQAALVFLRLQESRQ